MRIGIDLLGTGRSDGDEASGHGGARRLLSGLLGHGHGHAFVLYDHPGVTLRGLPSLPHVTLARAESNPLDGPAQGTEAIEVRARTNPDRLDWLLLLDPFAAELGHGPPIRPRDGVRLAAVVRDLNPFHGNDVRAARAVTRLRQYDLLLATTAADRDELAALLVLPADRIVAIGAAGDTAFFGPERAVPSPLASRKLLAEIGIRRSFLLALADRSPGAVEAILAAHRALPDLYRQEYPLVLVGARPQGRPEGVAIALESASPATWRVLCQNASACLFPGRATAALVEAMQCGALIVAGDGPASTEVLGNAGLRADPGRPEALAEALASALGDWTLGQTLRRRALDRARLCSEVVVAGRLLEALAAALRAPASSVRLRVDHAHRRKPRVAVISAFSSGDAAADPDFSRLLAVLRATYTIDLYHEPDLDPGPSEAADLRPFERNDAIVNYHAVIYRSGPALDRESFLEQLRRRPGLVLLSADDLAPLPVDRPRLGVLRRVFDDAIAVTVPSPWCLEQVDAWLPDQAEKTVVVPTGSAGTFSAPEIPAWPQSAAVFVALLERCAAASRRPADETRTAPEPHHGALARGLS